MEDKKLVNAIKDYITNDLIPNTNPTDLNTRWFKDCWGHFTFDDRFDINMDMNSCKLMNTSFIRACEELIEEKT